MELQLENDFIGYIETNFYINTYFEAIQELHRLIKGDFKYLLKEYPKSKWNVGYKDDKTEKWVILYSISTSKIKKLRNLGLF